MNDTIEYTRPNGMPVPIGTRIGGTAISNWLASDIQYSSKTLNEWLAVLSEVSNASPRGGYLGTGNAFSVYANGGFVLIESEYSESLKACLTIKQLTTVLLQYKSHLQSEFRDPAFVPLPFEVEYVAEGDSAKEHFLTNGGLL